MGVIYVSGDDVADLLIPFVHEHGGTVDAAEIDALYHEASIGQLSANDFWKRVGVSADLEDDYLARFTMTDDLPQLLEGATPRFAHVYCLSNDVPAWSAKLRRRFGLEPYFSGWFISGELGMRKPDPAIFEHVLAEVAAEPADVTFVDDRLKNLNAAAALGIQTALYDPSGSQSADDHRVIRSLLQLLDD